MEAGEYLGFAEELQEQRLVTAGKPFGMPGEVGNQHPHVCPGEWFIAVKLTRGPLVADGDKAPRRPACQDIIGPIAARHDVIRRGVPGTSDQQQPEHKS